MEEELEGNYPDFAERDKTAKERYSCIWDVGEDEPVFTIGR